MEYRSLYENSEPVLIKKEYEYAGFGARLGAYIIDWLIFSPIIDIVFINYEAGIIELFARNFICIALFAAYHVFFETGNKQGTIGKIILNLKVIRQDGQRLTNSDSLIRFFASLLSGLIFCIGYVIVVFDNRKRTLHDHIAGTYVVKA